jgi:hypothetical protein
MKYFLLSGRRSAADFFGKEPGQKPWRTARLALGAALLFAGCTPTSAGPSVDIVAHVDGDVMAGQPVTITLSGPVGKPDEFHLPGVDGLTVNGTGADPNTSPPSYNFFVTPAHAGDYTIPAFYLHSDDGQTYHVEALTLHVTGG